jgi:DNA polymerase (family 10)
MYDAGGWVLLESAIADLPVDLRWLFESGAVTIEQLAALHGALGATSAADLRAAVRSAAVRNVAGLDVAVESAIAAALPTLRASIPRIPLGRAMTIADPFLSLLRDLPGVEWAELVGSLRRGQDLVGDIEMVAAAADAASVFEALLRLPDLTRTLHRGPRRLYLLRDRAQVGIRCPAPDEAGAALLYLTGTAAHFDGLSSLARGRGWTLEPEGLTREAGSPRLSQSEEQIYAALELPCIPPEIRNGDDEIAAARQGTLPTLIARTDIRGDLHMHTDFSDGRDTIEAMVKQCVLLGYEYLAITDHSPHSASSRNLSTDSVKRQAEDIAGLRERYPQVAILHGCEVDILPDGRLDFSDRVLERLDIVLVSLHEGAGHSPEHLLRRYLGAMRHPLVTLITHPTNRLLPYRAGYDIDYDSLFAAAVETRTVLEIDGAPAHLDLHGALARRAVAAGATVAVNSDCHRAEMLQQQMQLGITTARRGWVEPRHVLNTKPIDEIRALIAAKRAR